MTLTRFRELPYCTLGRLNLMERQWFALERPWVPGPGKAGAPGQSRVPAGRYRLERHNSEAHPNSYALVNPALGVWHYPWEIPESTVDGRCVVLIHPYNYARESRGCIAPGKEQRIYQGTWGVFRSREAMNEIIQLLQRTIDLELVIEENFMEAS